MSKISMLPIAIVDDAEGGVHYGDGSILILTLDETESK